MRRPSADRGRGHHRAGVAAPAGEVDDAEHLVRDRVPDRHPGTGELLEVLDVVLVAEHPRRAAAFERGADAVRADVLLGVAEAGGQPHPVQARLEPRVAGVAGEHDAVGVAEDDAHGFVPELLRGLAQHRAGGAQQGGLAVEVGLERHVEVVHRHVPQPGPGPRSEDRLPDDLRGRDALGQERRAGQRQPGGSGVLRGQQGVRVRCGVPVLRRFGQADLLGAAAVRGRARSVTPVSVHDRDGARAHESHIETSASAQEGCDPSHEATPVPATGAAPRPQSESTTPATVVDHGHPPP